MKKGTLITAALAVSASLLLTSCGDARGLDRLRYKEVRVGVRRVLVDRFSDKVTYFLSNGKWQRLSPQPMKAIQALYDYNKKPR